MNRLFALFAVIVAASLSAGCAVHHAVVKTGIDPGPRQLRDEWADAYWGGAVPPDSVDAGAGCGESGVAMVETRQSFLNQLVSGLTLGIYSPMEIVVTCGSAEETGETPPEDDEVRPEPSSTRDEPKKSSSGSGGG